MSEVHTKAPAKKLIIMAKAARTVVTSPSAASSAMAETTPVMCEV